MDKLTEEDKRRVLEIAAAQNRISFIVAFVVCFFYFSFIVAVGAAPDLVGKHVLADGTTVGIIWGLGLILGSIIISYFFIKINSKYTDEIEHIVITAVDRKPKKGGR